MAHPSGKTAVEYVKPQFSPADVDAAGRAFVQSASVRDQQLALEVINNWRAAHHYPLNAITVALKQRARKVHEAAIISQRLKRLASVDKKLRTRSWIRLSKMQDIGGCRAVMPDLEHVYRLVSLQIDGPSTHTLTKINDYIMQPKVDGYRSVHLIYQFGGRAARAQEYAERGMHIELQLRTQLQHYWATAVETAETFSKQPLKSVGGKNDSPWREFFALVSTGFARMEGTQPVPGIAANRDEVSERLRELDGEFHFLYSLESYRVTVDAMSKQRGAKYFLLVLDPESTSVHLQGFRSSESEVASAAYASEEQRSLFGDNKMRVLVSVDDVAQLKRAYPNYFLDTSGFVRYARYLMR